MRPLSEFLVALAALFSPLWLEVLVVVVVVWCGGSIIGFIGCIGLPPIPFPKVGYPGGHSRARLLR